MKPQDLKSSEEIEKTVQLLKDNYYDKKLEHRKPESVLAFSSSIDDAWNLYAGALKTFAGGSSNLQLVSMASLQEKLLWDDKDFGDYYFHKNMCDLMNGLGANYNKTDRSLSNHYFSFIEDIVIPKPDTDAIKEATSALKIYNADSLRHNNLCQGLNDEWVAFDRNQRHNLPTRLWKTYDQWWFSDPIETSPNTNYNNSRQLVLANYANYNYWIQKALNGGQAIAQILRDFQESKKIKVLKPMSGNSSQIAGFVEILPYQISEDYSRWLSSARSGALSKTILHIKRDSYKSDVSQSSIGAGFGIGLGFFGLFAGGIRSTIQIDTDSQNFELSMEGVFKSFDLSCGDWYNSSAFSLFRNGPFMQNSPMDTLNKTNAIFGPRGFLNFKPSRAIVVFGPKLTIRFDRTVYHYFEQETRGFAGFCIGPFVIGGGAYYDHKVTVTTDSDNYTFSFEIKDYPILIAVDNEAL